MIAFLCKNCLSYVKITKKPFLCKNYQKTFDIWCIEKDMERLYQNVNSSYPRGKVRLEFVCRGFYF